MPIAPAAGITCTNSEAVAAASPVGVAPPINPITIVRVLSRSNGTLVEIAEQLCHPQNDGRDTRDVYWRYREQPAEAGIKLMALDDLEGLAKPPFRFRLTTRTARREAVCSGAAAGFQVRTLGMRTAAPACAKCGASTSGSTPTTRRSASDRRITFGSGLRVMRRPAGIRARHRAHRRSRQFPSPPAPSS